MAQTTYPLVAPVSAAGRLANLVPDTTLARTNSAGASVGFGLGVRQDPSLDDSFTNFSGTPQVFLGVLRWQQQRLDIDNDVIVDEETGLVLTKGHIYVVTEEAVTPTDNVFYRHTAGGGGSVIGAFRTDGDSSTADQLTNARWMETTSAAGIAVLSLNIP